MWLFSDVLPEAESWVCVFDGKMTTRGREREETNKHQNWKWKVEDLGQRRIGDLGESLQEGKRNTTEGGRHGNLKPFPRRDCATLLQRGLVMMLPLLFHYY